MTTINLADRKLQSFSWRLDGGLTRVCERTNLHTDDGRLCQKTLLAKGNPQPPALFWLESRRWRRFAHQWQLGDLLLEYRALTFIFHKAGHRLRRRWYDWSISLSIPNGPFGMLFLNRTFRTQKPPFRDLRKKAKFLLNTPEIKEYTQQPGPLIFRGDDLAVAFCHVWDHFFAITSQMGRWLGGRKHLGQTPGHQPPPPAEDPVIFDDDPLEVESVLEQPECLSFLPPCGEETPSPAWEVLAIDHQQERLICRRGGPLCAEYCVWTMPQPLHRLLTYMTFTGPSRHFVIQDQHVAFPDARLPML